MLKRILTAACVAALAAGCGTDRDTSSSSSGGTTSSNATTTTTSSTGSSGSHGTTGSSSSGSTGGSTTSGSGSTTGTNAGSGSTTSGSGSTTGTTSGCVSIKDARALASGTHACVNGATVVAATNQGNLLSDGGTQFDGTYYVVDPATGDAMYVFKSKASPPTSTDPVHLSGVNVDATISVFPSSDPHGLVELAITSTKPGTITDAGAGQAVPTWKTPTFAELAHDTATAPVVGSYVMVPPGQYTQTNEPAFRKPSGSNVYQNGFALSDTEGHSVWVDTYTMLKGSSGHDKSCLPTDGGVPDFGDGGFRGVLDFGVPPGASDAGRWAIIYFGDCSDKPAQ